MPPELDEILDAMGLAAEMKTDPIGKQSNGQARKIEGICTGDSLALVRSWCADFRRAKSFNARHGLACNIYSGLDEATAGYAVESAPVTALGV